MTRKLTWKPAAVGCYWNADDFTIFTRVLIENGRMVLTYPKSGYVLTRNSSREELGIFKTLRAAQRSAERRRP